MSTQVSTVEHTLSARPVQSVEVGAPLEMCDHPRLDAADVLTTAELATRLRAWAEGGYSTEAAVELLIAHRTWLQRPAFLDAVWVDGEFAGVDWDVVAERCAEESASSTELQVLQIICGLAGQPSGEPLDALISGLDTRNATLVVNAVWHCEGLHERHATTTVTGRFDEPDRAGP